MSLLCDSTRTLPEPIRPYPPLFPEPAPAPLPDPSPEFPEPLPCPYPDVYPDPDLFDDDEDESLFSGVSPRKSHQRFSSVVTESASEPSGERIAVRERVSEANMAIAAGERADRFAAAAAAYSNPVQKPDLPNISCLTDRWGTRQDGETCEGFTFSIPGSGEITKDDCGAWIQTAACGSNPKHYSKRISKNCGRVECPICWTGPVGRAARNASARLRGYTTDALQKRLREKYQLTVNHFTTSPLYGVITPDMPYNKIKQRGRDIAAKAGITGGFMGFHPFRIKKSVAWRLARLCDDNLKDYPDEREKKFWELVRADALGLGSWRDYVRWSPHFHIVGFGRLPDQKTDEDKEAVRVLYKGWVVKWIRHVDTYRQFDGTKLQDPIAELIFYILSHAGYQAGRKMPVWLGVCSPNNLHAEETTKEEYLVVCPKCGSPVIVGCGDPDNGTFMPDRDPDDGGTVQYILKCREIRYVIGRNPRNRERAAWKAECEAARLGRLAMGLT